MMKAIPSRTSRVVTEIPTLATDAIWLGGAGLISYGAWLIYRPAGFIVAGVLMIGAATLLSATGISGNPSQ
jgi:hypothetical protein